MLHVGDTLPALTDTLIGEDGPLDLDGATVELTLVGPATIEGTATIGETAGAVSYPWADGDTEVGGIYQARWRVTTVAGVRTITGTDVAIYDPDAVWITPAEVGEPDLPIDVVVRQLIAAQQRIVDWCTRTIPSPTPSKVKEALATLTRRALREPASAGGAAVSYESLADYAVRYVSPFAKGTVLDPAAHPDIVEMLRPWRPTGYSSDISGDGESVDRADTVDEVPNGLPEGGAVGRVLAKASGRDYDVEWIPAPTGIPAGGAPGQILARSADGLEWIDPTDGAAPLTEAVMAEIDDGSVLPATGGAFYGAGTAYLPAAASITSPRAMIVSATSDDVVVAGDDDPTIYDANGEAVATVTIPRGWSALVASDGTAWRVLGLADANETNDSHTVAAWMLVRSSFDPTVTPTVMPPGAALYLFTAEQGVEYAHAGLWYGTSDGVTPSLMVPSRRKVRTADMFLSRAFLDARGGFVDGLPQPELDEFDQPTPVLPSEFPQSYRSPRRVDGYVSSVSGPAAPVWSPVMEFDFADVKVAPSVDDLSDFELGTPNPGDVPTWDPGTGGDPEDPGYIPGRFVPVPAPSGAVTSVNGLDGDVVLTASDVGADPAGTAAAAVSALVAGAPGALDTLNELAAAINDDASYAAAVTTALSGKQASSSELTLLAALTTTSFGRSLLEKANAAAVASALGIERGGSRVVAVHGAGNTINEPTSATSILTSGAFTLPALAAGDRWVLEGDFDAVQNSGASRNLTLTAAFGATNATATAASVTASSTTRSCTFRIVGVCLTPTSHSITVHWDYPSVLVRGKATSTVDTSSAGTVLDLKVTTSAASTTQTFQLTNATLTVDRAAT